MRRRKVDLQSSPSPQSNETSRPNDPNHGLALQIVYRPIGELTPPPRRLRKVNTRQDAAIRAVIKECGNLDPLLITPEGRIVCGYARWRAAVDLGLEEVPTITISHLSDEQLRIYAIAEEKLGELGEWDREALRLEFAELELNVDLDLELTGFTMGEIDGLLIETEAAERTLPGLPSHQPVSLRGDLWQLGKHRLYCGNALEEQSYRILMGRERAQIVFCTPPCSETMDDTASVERAGSEMVTSGNHELELASILSSIFALMSRFSADGSIHYHCADWRHQRAMLSAGEAVYPRLCDLVVWHKNNASAGSCYRSQHELIYVWQVGNGPPINNVASGDASRYRTNVWAYDGDEEFAEHRASKPVALIADALRDCSRRGGIVLDAFAGSGSTLMAAQHTGRQARLIEIDPGCCDKAIERWQAKTGQEAMHAESGKSWTDVAAERGVDIVGHQPCDEEDD